MGSVCSHPAAMRGQMWMQREPLSRGMRRRQLRIWSARAGMVIAPRGGKARYKWSKAVKRYTSAVRTTSSREQC